MQVEEGFSWLVVDVPAGTRYKFTDGADAWQSDPWSRAYGWDEFGQFSLVGPQGAHLERHFQFGTAPLLPRTLRVWIPADAPTHVLYAHDGQNLFNPTASYGGWKLDQSAPASLMIVGIDNTDARIEEYTLVMEGGSGGMGTTYAAFVQDEVRPLVRNLYGEPAKVGTMGSSLGGLIALSIADLYPDEYDYVARFIGHRRLGLDGRC